MQKRRHIPLSALVLTIATPQGALLATPSFHLSRPTTITEVIQRPISTATTKDIAISHAKYLVLEEQCQYGLLQRNPAHDDNYNDADGDETEACKGGGVTLPSRSDRKLNYVFVSRSTNDQRRDESPGGLGLMTSQQHHDIVTAHEIGHALSELYWLASFDLGGPYFTDKVASESIADNFAFCWGAAAEGVNATQIRGWLADRKEKVDRPLQTADTDHATYTMIDDALVEELATTCKQHEPESRTPEDGRLFKVATDLFLRHFKRNMLRAAVGPR